MTYTKKSLYAGINEGGDGYDPERIRKQAQADAEHAASQAGKKPSRDNLLRQLEIADSSMARECGTYDADKVAAIRAQIAAIDAERAAKFAETWTLEVTQSRRAAWNAMVRANTVRGKIADAVIRQYQADQGYRADDLRKAIKMHGL